ncbi:prepilin-type N-terminal cleavage/methylation domain-containing protein [Candidatus Peregrinibacteria bacterium]|jgi:prepilin-type N-terminal cleavage/methylation domain-containing protein|nr:prepilin-type N-terminal cleavage/methylation domain-containing protein [Candidatus Peregrinibacteria bacterium]MBT4367483.1 prepilin-type N-terminal cleavage/methylation domain-containing protein [Candidatus Peregrinibacteria bacterium]MBT4586069.1 prepilin-type N-terminal cleavage/methylation domain-containing protein [Candidatus Peregrinibacteria bacterium]MBT6731124.1 prepilin-type N-terminal cleavage/methylation domain-containing protein [Candidatus Peregrinibacteria bacterium]MBT700901
MLKTHSKIRHYSSGFTMPEILITLAVFLVMASLSLPYLGDFFRNENAEAHCKRLNQAIYRASYRSNAGENGLSWGVYASGDSYTLFAGDSYATRDTNLDETITLPSTMTIVTPKTFHFQKYSGLPDYVDTVSITLGGITTQCASVNSAGLVE